MMSTVFPPASSLRYDAAAASWPLSLTFAPKKGCSLLTLMMTVPTVEVDRATLFQPPGDGVTRAASGPHGDGTSTRGRSRSCGRLTAQLGREGLAS